VLFRSGYELRGEGDIKAVDSILYKDKNGLFYKTRFHCWEDNLDSIPFPARQYMNNKLYVRPDTQRPMATIQTSRGCSAACIYCVAWTISGKKVRYRSPENVMAEIEECYNVFGIRDFFFRADTFTMNARWTKTLCELIIKSPLRGKIEFTANSRTNPLSRETLSLMKKAGCFAVAFGFESGSDETLLRIKKGSDVAHNLLAAKWAHEIGLKMYGFFMIGFPWENQEHLNQTRKHIFEIDADFIELYIALPFYGTPLYDMCKESGVLAGSPLGNDHFNSNLNGTEFLSLEDLIGFKSKLIHDYYVRPSYIIRRLGDCLRNPGMLPNYVHYGLKIIFRKPKLVFQEKSYT
jgi:radical SAM superfamily enzyme YgiQ (UPF0313 family)